MNLSGAGTVPAPPVHRRNTATPASTRATTTRKGFENTTPDETNVADGWATARTRAGKERVRGRFLLAA